MCEDEFDSGIAPHDGSLEVRLLGLVDLDAMIGLQEYEVYQLGGRESTDGILFLCEHPPSLSMGREAGRDRIPWENETDEKDLCSARWVSRGGGAFAHGPGQLAIYPVFPLQRLGIGLSKFRELLETAVVLACRDLKVQAKRNPESPGLWSRDGHLGHFGAGVRSWISCHGLFLNVSTEPRIMKLTEPNPFGIPAASMQSQRLDPIRMAEVKEAVIRRVTETFRFRMADVVAGHPLLKPVSRVNSSHV